MSDRAFYAHFSAMSDDQLRSLFWKMLESPGSIHDEYADAWRKWLVKTLLEHFYENPPRQPIDQRRYVAFALHYLAAIDTGSEKAGAELVQMVMETRPEVVEALLFGPIETRLAAIRAAFGHPVTWERPVLEGYQEDSLQRFKKVFRERANDTGMPAFNDKTVGNWWRYAAKGLMKVVLNEIRPTQQAVREERIRGMLGRPRSEGNRSDRERLVQYLELCKKGRQSLNYGMALAALNDYDRRAENEEQRFKSQRRLVLVMFLLFGVIGGAVLLGSWPGLPDWLHMPMVVVASCAVLGVVVTVQYVFINIIAGTVSLTEHITRTRTDIQTLHQLVDGTPGPDQG